MYTGFVFKFAVLSVFFFHSAVSSKATISEHHIDSHVKQVAIIGAGAAGSSTAYHLRKFADEAGIALNITIFEKTPFIGGRTRTVNAYDDPQEPTELGASIFVDVNAILKNATLQFGLPLKESETDNNDLLGIWNGETFVFKAKEGNFSYWYLAKMFWKYGFSPMRTQKLMKKSVGQFLKLYEPPFFPFRSLSSRAIDLDLVSYSGLTGRQLLEANNIGEPFSTDIIQASTRVNYALNLNHIHGLETMVCMAIEGAVQIKGGNWQIFDQMVQAANVNLLRNTTVNSIVKSNTQYSVKVESVHDDGISTLKEEVFDAVVLAAPFQYAQINFPEKLLKHVPDEIPYVKLHVTLFASPYRLSHLYFGLKETDVMPVSILTTLPPNSVLNGTDDESGPAGFFSISTLRTVSNPKTGETEFLYKIFSPQKITSGFLSGILGVPVPDDLTSIAPNTGSAISWYYPHVWNSYPIEKPRITFDDIELARHFYYTSGVESFISTMETSALMGMNVARLITDDFLNLLAEKKASGKNKHGSKVESGQVVITEKGEL